MYKQSDETSIESEDWRVEALSWTGRKVRIVDGPSKEDGHEETGVVICVDATDYRPSGWVKLTHGSSYPSYRSCDLRDLVDAVTGESGPSWSLQPTDASHGQTDNLILADRINSVQFEASLDDRMKLALEISAVRERGRIVEWLKQPRSFKSANAFSSRWSFIKAALLWPSAIFQGAFTGAAVCIERGYHLPDTE